MVVPLLWLLLCVLCSLLSEGFRVVGLNGLINHARGGICRHAQQAELPPGAKRFYGLGGGPRTMGHVGGGAFPTNGHDGPKSNTNASIVSTETVSEDSAHSSTASILEAGKSAEVLSTTANSEKQIQGAQPIADLVTESMSPVVAVEGVGESDPSYCDKEKLFVLFKKKIILFIEFLRKCLRTMKTKFISLFTSITGKWKVFSIIDENEKPNTKFSLDKVKEILNREEIESARAYVQTRVVELVSAKDISSKNPHPGKYLLGSSGEYYDPNSTKRIDQGKEKMYPLVKVDGAWVRSAEEIAYMEAKSLRSRESEPSAQGDQLNSESDKDEESEFQRKLALANLAAEESLERARAQATAEAEENRIKWAA